MGKLVHKEKLLITLHAPETGGLFKRFARSRTLK